MEGPLNASSPSAYGNIEVAGGDTGRPLALAKRMGVLGRYISKSDRGKSLLDCGSGTGNYVVEIMRRFHLDAHGVEYLMEKVREAELNPELKGRIKHGDLEALAYPSNSFDFALLNEVLEHVPNDQAALQEISRILKPGGLLFSFSPNRCFPIETHGVAFKATGQWLVSVPFIPYIPMSIARHLFKFWARNYWPWQLLKMVRRANFEVIKHGSIALTFENISRGQPFIVKFLKPALRRTGTWMEKLPLLSHCGASQFLVCRKITD